MPTQPVGRECANDLQRTTKLERPISDYFGRNVSVTASGVVFGLCYS